jgi:cytochrome c
MICTVAKILVRLSALALLAPSVMAEGGGSAPEQGQLVFNNYCRNCHTTKEGDNRLGPNLYHVVGRKAGSVPGFSYSSAMAGADLVWDKSTLDRFMAQPDQVVSGNRMKPFGGVPSADERSKIIAFLETSP